MCSVAVTQRGMKRSVHKCVCVAGVGREGTRYLQSRRAPYPGIPGSLGKTLGQ